MISRVDREKRRSSKVTIDWRGVVDRKGGSQSGTRIDNGKMED